MIILSWTEKVSTKEPLKNINKSKKQKYDIKFM
jgi:hypothetical protein